MFALRIQYRQEDLEDVISWEEYKTFKEAKARAEVVRRSWVKVTIYEAL
jgi:hypothetical protein